MTVAAPLFWERLRESVGDAGCMFAMTMLVCCDDGKKLTSHDQ